MEWWKNQTARAGGGDRRSSHDQMRNVASEGSVKTDSFCFKCDSFNWNNIKNGTMLSGNRKGYAVYA